MARYWLYRARGHSGIPTLPSSNSVSVLSMKHHLARIFPEVSNQANYSHDLGTLASLDTDMVLPVDDAGGSIFPIISSNYASTSSLLFYSFNLSRPSRKHIFVCRNSTSWCFLSSVVLVYAISEVTPNILKHRPWNSLLQNSLKGTLHLAFPG